MTIDARTSDAIAIAMRTRSPIYTTPRIVEETGFVMEPQPSAPADSRQVREVSLEDIASMPVDDNDPLDDLSIEQLQTMLADMIAEERYEEAARISDVIKKKQSEA